MTHNFIMNVGEGNIVKVECHEKLRSTHELARHYAKIGYPDKYIVFSEKQTGFNSLGEKLDEGEDEKGVYLSCILRPSIFPSQAGLLGAMSAVALISALEEHTTKHLGLGWVSTLYCEGASIGRVNIEGKLDSFSSYEYIIVTFAVKLSDQNFPPRLTDLIKKVFESESSSVSMIIAKNILAKFLSLFPKNLKSKNSFMEIYKQKFILTGKRVFYVSDSGGMKIGKIIGVDTETGVLLLETRRKKVKEIHNQKKVIIPRKIRIKKQTANNSQVFQ